MGKKIVICCNVYPPCFIGGAELVAHAQAKILKDLGHNIIVFTGDIQGWHKRHSIRREIYEGLTVYRVCLTSEDYPSDRINFFHKEVEEHFKKLLDEFLPDVVHFHNIIGLSVGLIHIAKQKGIKTVMTLHDHWGFCLKNTIIRHSNEVCRDFSQCAGCMPSFSDENGNILPIQMRQSFISLQLQDIDAFISPSRYLADAYIDAGIPADKFHVIWNGVDVQEFMGIEKIFDAEHVRFTFIGYFGMHKGIHVLLEALQYLGDRDRYVLNLVGDGELLAEYKSKVQNMGLGSSVIFWGKIKEIEDAYAQTDVLILPSIWPENQPVTITEAMAAGIPVIASNSGGIPELIEDGKAGLLFETGNARDLARKMSDVIRNPEKIKIFGKGAYQKIKANTCDNQVKKILELYDHVISRGPSNGEQTKKQNLIICYRDHIDHECFNIINTISKNPEFSNCQFIMFDWLQDDQIRPDAILWVLDESVDKEALLPMLKYNLSLLVPEKNCELKQLCIDYNCGLYYQTPYEAEGALLCLLSNKKIRSTLAANGYTTYCLSNKLRILSPYEKN